MTRPTILLSEGSSTNARETITALGLAGYHVDVCDPNPACLARFSRFVGRVHRCPASGTDPMGYLRTVIRLVWEHGYDVLLPVNEQAYLFAWAHELLEPLAGLALADFEAFTQVQTKTAFVRLLDDLGLPHPTTRIVHDWTALEDAMAELGHPCWIKTPEGTASIGVWRIRDRADAAQLSTAPGITRGLDSPDGLVVQAQAMGSFEQAHAIFDHGRLVALRTGRRLAEGTNGGPALKVGVDRPLVADQFRLLGTHLSWHGGFSADYFWDEASQEAAYIDCNPRLTEPMNSLVNGVNLADLHVRLSLGEELPDVPGGTLSARSHGLIHSILGAAVDGEGRRGVLAAATTVVGRRGDFRGSVEGLTPLRVDPPSVIAAGYTLARLLVNPGCAQRLATDTIVSYSLGQVIPHLAGVGPETFGLARPAAG
jgi:predicted ATP-grasp superfamily ATP-dependent carboligase